MARHYDLATEGTVAKADVLAYIVYRGENAIIVRPEHVKRAAR